MQPQIAFLFDMDGVIIDSTETHTDAWIAYLRSHGLNIPDAGKRMLGKHNDEIVRDFFGQQGLTDEMISDHGSRKEQIYREMIAPNLLKKLVPGVPEFLSRHSDIPSAMGTNAEPANIEFVLDRSGLKRFFSALVSGFEVKRPKPFPDVYLRAAEMLGAAPECCIVFEDSHTGVAAARAAGMRVVGLLTTLSTFGNVDLEIRDFCDPNLERWLTSQMACA
ncbi:MAG: HAD family phosphatase [Bryobacteraceae bacterium]|nr:HAD family phosphatase [Bryobacteraceae bacterium]